MTLMHVRNRNIMDDFPTDQLLPNYLCNLMKPRAKKSESTFAGSGADRQSFSGKKGIAERLQSGTKLIRSPFG